MGHIPPTNSISEFGVYSSSSKPGRSGSKAYRRYSRSAVQRGREVNGRWERQVSWRQGLDQDNRTCSLSMTDIPLVDKSLCE